MYNELVAIYDLELCPTTFDLANFLVLSENHRVENHFDHIKLIILKASGSGYKKGNIHTLSQHNERLRTILCPLARMLPSIASFHIVNDRSSLYIEHIKDEKKVFPPNYTVQKPSAQYSWQAIWDSFFVKKQDLQPLLTPQYMLDIVYGDLEQKSMDIKKLVTITLRQSDYQTSRNSCFNSWIKFSQYLCAQGFQPLFIYDYDHISSHDRELLERHPNSIRASVDLLYRMALYELSFLSFFVNNGPWVPAIFNKNINLLCFKMITEDIFVTSTRYRINCNDPIGQNYEFLTDQQKIVWKDDDYTTLVEEFNNYLKQHSNLATLNVSQPKEIVDVL